MVKINYMIIMLFLFSHCSIDTKTGLWKNKNVLDNQKKDTLINFSEDLTFNDFKENVIFYSKNSKYPIIGK